MYHVMFSFLNFYFVAENEPVTVPGKEPGSGSGGVSKVQDKVPDILPLILLPEMVPDKGSVPLQVTPESDSVTGIRAETRLPVSLPPTLPPEPEILTEPLSLILIVMLRVPELDCSKTVIFSVVEPL